MRYRVKGLEIRTENTAKVPAQAARGVLSFIRHLPRVRHACDIGCGKLRYAAALASLARRLTLVDSEVQLTRAQVIHGKKTTVQDYVATHMGNCETQTISEFLSAGARFDFVLCANVLSAIPQTRARSCLLRGIRRALRPTGRCLFVTQYRNSYFKAIAGSDGAVPHLDGWLLKTAKGAFYYGLLPPDKLVALVARHGFTVVTSWTTDQMALVLAGCKSPERSREGRVRKPAIRAPRHDNAVN